MIRIPDDPIARLDQDLLNRSRFANSIADLILDAPEGASFRVGVFGGWGEGKSSVLRMIEDRIRTASHLPVWFVPWGSATSAEMWERLISEIARAVGVKSSWWSPAAAVSRKAASTSAAMADADWKFAIAQQTLGKVLERVAETLGAKEKDSVLRSIARSLGRRRLVVLVDDVDRLSPELVPPLLLGLRQILDFPNTYFVIALSGDVVKRALTAAHPGYAEDPNDFLEKIIEYPVHLPPLTEKDASRMVRSYLPPDDPRLDSELIASLGPLLPTNPRKLKLFLRLLVGLRSQLDRFTPEELDRRTTFVTQLLRIEFPEEARALARDKAAMGHIQAPEWALDEKEGEPKRPEAAHAPEREPGRSRFLDLCAALRASGRDGGEYPLAEIIDLVESPPELTWREMDGLFRGYQSGGVEVLTSWVSLEPGERATRAESLWLRSVELYDRLLGIVADLDTVAQMASVLKGDVAAASELILDQIRSSELMRGRLQSEQWADFNSRLMKWSRWRKIEVYETTRAKELELIQEAFSAMGKSERAELVQLFASYHFEQTECAKEYREVLETISSEAAHLAAEAVLRTFATPDGVSRYWGTSSLTAEKIVAFDPDSTLHKGGRARLLEVLRQAPESVPIHLNSLTYLRMLMYGALRGGSLSVGDCRRLLAQEDLVASLWTAVTSRALNPRAAGSLNQQRDALISGLKVDPEWLRLPSWWEELIEIGFLPAPGTGIVDD